MANLPIDMKKFKKVAGDKDSTTMESTDGHRLKIAHKPLSAKYRAQLQALPVHMADGGMTPDEDSADSIVQDAASQAQAATPSSPPITINVGNPALAAAPAQTQGQATAYGAAYGIDPNAAPKPIEVPADPQGAAYANAINAKNAPPAPAPEAKTPPAVSEAPQAAPTAPQQPQAAQDPYGTQTHLDQFAKGAGEYKAGLAQQAAAQAAQGQAEAETLQQAQQKIQAAQETYKTHYSELDNERKAFQADISNSHIDPNRYLGSQDTGTRISTAIGLLLGGIGAGMLHQENPALRFLNDQINRDIDAQKSELGKKENLLSANMRQFGNMRDATDMTRIMMNDLVATQMKEAAAKAATPMAKAQLYQNAGKFDVENSAQLGQLAMRKTLLTGMQQGQVAPERVVMALVPKEQQASAYKELQSAQNLSKSKDNALSAFDQVSNMTLAGALSPSKRDAIVQPILAQMVKDSEGRITPQDTAMIAALFPSAKDVGQETRDVKRNQLNKFLSEKMNFPILKAYGIDAGNMGRYSPQGQSRIQFKPQ